MQSDNFLYLLEEANRKGESVAIATLIKDGEKIARAVVTQSGEIISRFSDNDLLDKVKLSGEELLRGASKVTVLRISDRRGDIYDVVFEVLRPKIRMYVFGSGHVGQAVSLIGAMLGYAVRVFDDRGEMLARDRFPDSRIELTLCDYEKVGNVLGELTGAVIVIVTRGHQFDEDCLRAVIGSNASYIGMIGSRRRVISIFNRLKNEGISDREIEKVHAPIGLRIGAATPQEIAVSILAEIIQKLNNHTVGKTHTRN